jgi:hypothetical protein
MAFLAQIHPPFGRPCISFWLALDTSRTSGLGPSPYRRPFAGECITCSDMGRVQFSQDVSPDVLKDYHDGGACAHSHNGPKDTKDDHDYGIKNENL